MNHTRKFISLGYMTMDDTNMQAGEPPLVWWLKTLGLHGCIKVVQ